MVEIEHQFVGLHNEVWKVCNLTGCGKRHRLQRMLQTLKNPSLALVLIHFRHSVTRTNPRLLLSGVSVEKVSQLRLVAVQGWGYKQAKDAAVKCNVRRPAAHDGQPPPLRIAVPLLPPGRSGS